MEKIILLTVTFSVFCTHTTFSQDCKACPSKNVMNNTNYIFEGRILTDSAFFLNPPGIIYTYYNVLVLKQFMGVFKSDTLKVIGYGGTMSINGMLQGDYPAYAHKNDEAVFFVSMWSNKPSESDLLYIYYGAKGGFVKVCDKKDVVKEVYEPIEAVTGQKYVDVHPNTCATQQKK